MMYSKKEKEDFFNAVDSLKKYRRADITDEKGNTLIEKSYTDLLPNQQILQTCLRDNTTFLIGRKGTGKSTIFLRLEKDYRKNKNYISCYLDTKTIFETSKTEFNNLEYLKAKIPAKAMDEYLLQRTFIQNILIEVIKEVKNQINSLADKILKLIGLDKTNNVIKNLSDLLIKIENNEKLKSIEIPTVSEIFRTNKSLNSNSNENSYSNKNSIEGETNITNLGAKASMSEDKSRKISEATSNEFEDKYSQIFIKVFQIKDIIKEIKEIFSIIKINHLIILLDDFSEIDYSSMKTFVDVILSPLNNWSDEFIKFKIAAYPNRIYFGQIDKGKVDIIDLDFYNLYSEFDRNTMENRAIDFTKRLIENRINLFTNQSIEYFFDTRQDPIESYYEILFQISMNVPRIIGYILFYCYESNIIFDNPITKASLRSAAEKYFDKIIESHFQASTYSLRSFEEKISDLQQKELLDLFVKNLLNIKRKITSNELTGLIYNDFRTNPFTSHFYLNPNLEKFLQTLELNFFISKYSEQSVRDGGKQSIYCINYGLAVKRNLRWGKPPGSKHRKYFIERPFDFNTLIESFLKSSKKIVCINPDCSKVYPFEQLQFLEFAKMNCIDCHNPVKVISVSESIKDDLERIENSKLLPTTEFTILYELNKSNKPLFAKDIAEELDSSSQLIAKRAKNLDEQKGLIKREKKGQLLKYDITEKAKDLYFK